MVQILLAVDDVDDDAACPNDSHINTVIVRLIFNPQEVHKCPSNSYHREGMKCNTCVGAVASEYEQISSF